jgi:thymidylate synthase
MKEYLDLMQKVMDEGVDRSDRTGTGTRSLFGAQVRFDLQEGFPAVTTKRLAWKAMVSELIWFIEGSGDNNRLKEILHGDYHSPKGTIWSENAEASYWKPKAKFDGDLGRIYGVQWRTWQLPARSGWLGVWDAITGKKHYKDQLTELIDGIKKDPCGRRHIITGWNPGEINQMALPPCHVMSQFYVTPYSDDEIQTVYLTARGQLKTLEDRLAFDTDANGESRQSRRKTMADLQELNLPTGKLSCQLYQRSADLFLGVPFNIASYALFTHMIAQVCNLDVGEFVHTFGDLHIYHNHFDAVAIQLARTPDTMPQLKINTDVHCIESFVMDDFELVDYNPQPAIKAPMAV